MRSEAVIDVAELRVAYGDTVVLDGVDMRVERGKIVVVVGGSGCGKSTLLKAIIGLAPPRSGRIVLFGQDSTYFAAEERENLLRHVGIMFQYGALLNSLTVGQNVSLPLEMHTDLGPPLIEDIVRARLELVGLGHAYSLFPDELSGGMRKRAALARAMVLDPEILFCDEPGTGLDPITAAGIDHLLLTLNHSLGITLVVITHDLLSIERLNGRLVMLDEGKVVFAGSVAEAQTSADPVVRDFFHPGK